MKRNSKIVFLLSLIIVIFAFVSAFFLYKEIQKKSTLSIEARTRIEEINLQARNLKSFEDFISSTVEQRDKIESVFVKQNNQDNFLSFIKDLENTGSDIGLDINVESTNTTNSATDKGPSLHLSTIGSFEKVFKYSLLLENLQYEISFEGINFKKTEDGLWKGDYVIRLFSYEL